MRTERYNVEKSELLIFSKLQVLNSVNVIVYNDVLGENNAIDKLFFTEVFLLYFVKMLLKYYFFRDSVHLLCYIYFYARYVLKKKTLHNNTFFRSR